MPVGAPDGGYPSQQLASSVLDTGALGDRLLMGGGSVFKAGRLIWATGFENGSFTDFSFAGAGTVVALGFSSAAFGVAAWQGNYLGVLRTQAVINDLSEIFKFFPGTIVTGNWGIEAMVTLASFNCNFDIWFRKNGATGISGSVTQTAKIRIAVGADNTNILLQYMKSDGTFVTIANLSNIFSVGENVYYNIKFVVNFNQDQYVRLILNNTVYDLSGIGLQHTAAVNTEKADFNFDLTTTVASAATAGIDNVILTADEP